MKFRDQVHDEVTRRSRRRREGEAAAARAAQPATPPRNDLLPELRLERRRLCELKLPKNAVRKRSKAQIERLKTSIKAHGFSRPLMLSSEDEIIDGVTIAEAARQLGLNEAPCLIVPHLQPTAVREFRLALNRLGERGEWDVHRLRIELQELSAIGASLEATGFELPEIEALVLAEEPDPALDEAGAPEPGPAVTQLADGWRLGSHRVICGDARDPAVYDNLMGDEQARLVLTDQPYNVPIQNHVSTLAHAEFIMASGEMSDAEFFAFTKAWAKASAAKLTPGGLLASFIDWRGLAVLLRAGDELALEQLNLVVWSKTNGGMGSLWRSQHELLPVFKKPGAAHVNNVQLSKFGRWRSNVWEYPGASSLGSEARDGVADHPTPKPVALLQDALLDVTNPGDIVLEPFAGSGSTLLACETTGRRCRAIELSPAYVDLTVRRWERLTGKFAMHEETGLSFAQIAAERLGVAENAQRVGEPSDER